MRLSNQTKEEHLAEIFHRRRSERISGGPDDFPKSSRLLRDIDYRHFEDLNKIWLWTTRDKNNGSGGSSHVLEVIE